MNKRIKVNVTRGNIEKGKCGHTVLCPIAYALRDMGYKNVSVGLDVAHVYRFNTNPQKLAPAPGFREKMSSFVRDFDKGEDVGPIEIEMLEF